MRAVSPSSASEKAVIDRLECSHRPPCPGCPRFGRAEPPARAVEVLRDMCRRWGAAPPEVVSGRGPGYRHRARLSVRGRVTSPKVGIFQEGTHRIVDIPSCVVHHPLVNEVARALKRAMKATRTAPYSDVAHAGTVRALQVVVEPKTELTQVVIVARETGATSVGDLCDELQRGLSGRLHSLWFNGNPDRTNTIVGPIWEKITGPDAIEDEFGGARVFFPPDAFGQANPVLMHRIVADIHEFVPRGAKVAEFYAGCGAIGLGLLARGERVTFNEIGAGSLRGLESGIRASGGEERARVVPGTAGEAAGFVRDADVVIVDPPRKGLDAELLAALSAAPPEHFVYLSCGLDSFVRDIEALERCGLGLERVRAFGLFPYTDHVETLALFSRP